METLYFTKPNKEHLEALQSYKDEFLTSGDSMDGCGPLRRFDNLNDYLKYVYDCEQKETCPEGMVPASHFLCIRKSDQKLLGMIQIKPELNDYFRNYAGHIGYSVRPNERRKGYATWMLHNILPYCRSQGLQKIMVSCEDDNTASRKTILKNGGVLEHLVFDLLGGERFIWGCFSDNEASKKLALSAGFQYVESKEEVRDWDGYHYISDFYEKTKANF